MGNYYINQHMSREIKAHAKESRLNEAAALLELVQAGAALRDTATLTGTPVVQTAREMAEFFGADYQARVLRARAVLEGRTR